MGVKPIDIKKLEMTAANIYEAIVVMSKRARQINEEMKIEFNQRIEMLQTRILEPEEETEQPQTNPDQILIAQEFELRAKPPEVGIDEIMHGRISFRYKEDDPLPPVP